MKKLFLIIFTLSLYSCALAQSDSLIKQAIQKFTRLTLGRQCDIDSITSLCYFPSFDFDWKNEVYHTPSKMRKVISDARSKYFRKPTEFKIDSLTQLTVCQKIKFRLPKNTICYHLKLFLPNAVEDSPQFLDSIVYVQNIKPFKIVGILTIR